MVELLRASLLVSLLAIAVWSDVRSGKVPNRLTGSALLMALLLAAAPEGVGLDGALLAAGLTLLLGTALFALKVVGGGDVKLMVAVAALLGPALLGEALLLTAIWGAVFALLAAVRRRALLPVLLNTRDLLLSWSAPGRFAGRRTLHSPGAVTFPYSLAIAAGALGAWLT